ncbi:hypothetical protein Ahy_B09g095591 isoform K [Arachis hypogaea]|uniref:MULE transposase domain-containing protein n=1 Tax=Arachis hypogaea TaxID=3818 RepID=A0A444XFA0_ARAHY|nr:hypothetical protein Ahy_B09g095591 isoform K [Arachis hypogaea]
MLKQHRKLSMSIRRTIENNEEAGIRPSKTYQSFVAAAGGHRELNFIEKDMRNYITREVRNVSEQEDAKEFGKSRAAFEYFEDVISFDTTYNTNRYNLVCGSFVGVNHHGQSTLLGCSLMKNEEIESFKWLFQCWLHCMGENAPKGFLTDQCASMKKALEACMPTTVHRWCIWHIMKKIPSKLNGYKGHADIEQEMSQVVWNSHSKDSFDRNWNDFLLNFGLADNKWLLGNVFLKSAAEVYIAFPLGCIYSLCLGVLCRSVRTPSHMGSYLSGSPLLGRDEKHTKEREHAFIF